MFLDLIVRVYRPLPIVCLLSTWGMLWQASSCRGDGSLAQMRAAAQASRASLSSARGEGIIRIYRAGENLDVDATFALVFGGDKYHLDIRFKPVAGKPPRFTRQLAVCDGSAVLANRFSERIRPTGCEADVLVAKPGAVAKATHGTWSFTPTGWHDSFATPSLFTHDFAVEQLEDGKVRATRTYKSPDTELELIADRKVGYNLVSCRTQQQTDSGTTWVQLRTLRWERLSDMWILKSLSVEDTEDGEFYARREIVFDEFEANPIVDVVEFGLENAALCGGSRIIDRRPQASVKIHRIPAVPDEKQKRINSIAEAIEQIPAQQIERSPIGTGNTVQFRIIMFAALTVLCATVSWFLWQRR